MASRFDAQHESCNLWIRLVLTAQNDNDPHTRSTAVRMLKRIHVVLHEGIDTTGSTPSKFCNDDPALHQASLYPLCDTHNHISTLTALPAPEVTANATEDATHTPSHLPCATSASCLRSQSPPS
jgi:hypothetical protein